VDREVGGERLQVAEEAWEVRLVGLDQGKASLGFRRARNVAGVEDLWRCEGVKDDRELGGKRKHEERFQR
jgi:hypothetical protein